MLWKLKKWPSLIWNSAYWSVTRMWFSGSSYQALWRKLCEEAHDYPPLSWDIGLMWLGSKGGLHLPGKQKLWVHKALGAERRKDERGKEGGRTATWEHPFIIRAISLLIKWPCVNSSSPHSSRVIRRGTLADRSRPHGLLNQGEMPPPKELYVTQPSPGLTERHWGGEGDTCHWVLWEQSSRLDLALVDRGWGLPPKTPRLAASRPCPACPGKCLQMVLWPDPRNRGLG